VTTDAQVDGGPQAGNVQEQVTRALLQELSEEHTKPEVQAIVARIQSQFEPVGLRRLELGPENKDGDYQILAEASELQPAVLMQLARAGYSVRMASTVRFSTPQTLVTPRVFTSTGRERPGVPGGFIHTASVGPAGQLVHPEAGPERLTAVPAPERITSDVMQVTTYNRGGGRGIGREMHNDAHAERQFINWFKADVARASLPNLRLLRIDLSRSPCSLCVSDLCDFLENYVKPYVTPNAYILELRYDDVHRGDFATTNEDIAELRACFNNNVRGPAPNLTRDQAGRESRHAAVRIR
jgi:hypothetical protein